MSRLLDVLLIERQAHTTAKLGDLVDLLLKAGWDPLAAYSVVAAILAVLLVLVLWTRRADG